MAEHRYDLGQLVSLRLPFPDRTRSGPFEIVRRMPRSADGEFHYRVRGPDKIERAVGESALTSTVAV